MAPCGEDNQLSLARTKYVRLKRGKDFTEGFSDYDCMTDYRGFDRRFMGVSKLNPKIIISKIVIEFAFFTPVKQDLTSNTLTLCSLGGTQ